MDIWASELQSEQQISPNSLHFGPDVCKKKKPPEFCLNSLRSVLAALFNFCGGLRPLQLHQDPLQLKVLQFKMLKQSRIPQKFQSQNLRDPQVREQVEQHFQLKCWTRPESSFLCLTKVLAWMDPAEFPL